MKLDPTELHKALRIAKRAQVIGLFAIGLCTYVAADAIYDPSPLMIESPWWQALSVAMNTAAAVLNWHNVRRNEAFIARVRDGIRRVEEWNRVIGS